VTTSTVSNHVSIFLTELRLAGRTQASVAARDAGLGRTADPEDGDGPR